MRGFRGDGDLNLGGPIVVGVKAVRRVDQAVHQAANQSLSHGRGVTVERTSEIHDLNEIKRVGLFGWFLEVAASEVLEQTITELKRATDDIQLLIMFHATCFKERKGLFEKMFVKGERLVSEEIELFKDKPGFEALPEVFERLNSMLKLN